MSDFKKCGKANRLGLTERESVNRVLWGLGKGLAGSGVT